MTVSFTASDNLSGIASRAESVSFTGEGADQSVTGTAVDQAGNTASFTVSGINIDKTPPVITVISPVVGPYLTTDQLIINFSVADELSGVGTYQANLDGIAVMEGQTVDFAKMAGTHTFNVTAKDRAGNETSATVTFEVMISATVDIKPDTLNLGSASDKNAVTVYIEFPAGYDVNHIDLTTVSVNINGETVAVQASPTAIGDYDSNGIPDRMVKIERQAVITALGDSSGEVTMVVSGKLSNGTCFVGNDAVNVMAKNKAKK